MLTEALAKKFEPSCAAEAEEMGNWWSWTKSHEQALKLLNQALTMPFGAEERAQMEQNISQAVWVGRGTESYFRKGVLKNMRRVYEDMENMAEVARVDDLLRQYEWVKPMRVEMPGPPRPEPKEIIEARQWCETAQKHFQKQRWREAFADYEKALALIPMPKKDDRPLFKNMDPTKDRFGVVYWAAEALDRAGDKAGKEKFLRDQLVLTPAWCASSIVYELGKSCNGKALAGDEQIWKFLAESDRWDSRTESLIRVMLNGEQANEALKQRLRRLATNPDKETTYARVSGDLPLLEKAVQTELPEQEKELVLRALYDAYCKQGKLEEAEKLFPSVYPVITNKNTLDEWAKLAGLAARERNKEQVLRMWRKLLLHDLGDDERLSQVLVNGDMRKPLLALYEEVLARNPGNAELAKTVAFLRQ
jgi:tetratricopeptide (TPR) repeat protein